MKREHSIVHVGSQIAQVALKPVGKEVRVTQTSKELLEDLRIAACQFGQATDANEVILAWEKMQMRFYDLAYQMAGLERLAGVEDRTALMKF